MSELDDSFAKLLGRQPSDAERQQLYTVRDALGLKNNDALWLGNSQQITPQIFPEYHLKTYVFCKPKFHTSLPKTCPPYRNKILLLLKMQQKS
jgi:hypothetical protein